MRRSLFALAASSALFAACGEETPPPNEPEIVTGEVKCRKVGTESTYELNEVTVVVADDDGAEDLLDEEAGATVSMFVLSARLEPTMKTAEGEDRVRYSWQKAASDVPIFCGDDGKLLEVRFEATDTDGFPASALIRSRPL
jgi:hypothetical protein